jgi:hypothetical protein
MPSLSLNLLRRESPAMIVREALWRVRRSYLKRQFARRDFNSGCPVRFRPTGYYDRRQRLDSRADSSLFIDYAEALCRGEFRFLGYANAKLGLPPSWSLDFVSGKRWPQVSANRVVLIAGDGSDVKVPWELSRLQFLPVLAKAFRLTADARFRRCALDLLSDWIERNPVGVGIHWTVAMEAALRAVSICLTLEALWPFSADEAAWLRTVERSLWSHLHFIEAHSEFSHFCRSNHYLSNISGLYCLHSFLEGDGLERRRQLYRQALEREIQSQVYADGGHAEASTGYHVLATQLFALPFLLARSGGDEFSPEYARRLAAMFAWIACLSDDDGRLAHIGDCDDGRVELLPEDLEQMRLPLARRHSLHVASVLSLGRALFPATAKPHPASSPTVRVLPQSGVAVAQVGSAAVTFLAMPNGLDGKGSHTHNDKLSVLLRVGNDELLCDSGTGCYTRDPGLRNRLRATSAHSTLSVAGQEQNRIDGRHLFCLRNDAVPTPITATVENDSVTLSASHSGYVRIGIVHTRSLQLSSGELLITDTLTGAGEHGFQLTFQIPIPPTEVAILRRGDTQTCRVNGLRELELCCTAPVGLELKTQESEISRAYGATLSATRLLVSGRATLPLKIVTRISWR